MTIESAPTVTDQENEVSFAPSAPDAQSDAPIVEDPGKAEDAPQAGSDSTAEPSDTESEPASEPSGGTPAEQKLSGKDKRIDELTFRAKEAERQADYFRQQLEIAQSRLQPEGEETPLVEPKVEDYDDYGDYIKAVGQYGAKLQIREERQAEVQQASQNLQGAQQQISQARGATFKAKAEVFKQDHPDFDDLVIKDTTLPVNKTMQDAILEMDRGPEVAYHLAQNREEAHRIYQLSPVQAAVALGRIEAGLPAAAAPSPKTGGKAASAAPEPITPVTGSGSSEPKDSRRMSTEEWMDWRAKQLDSR